MLPLLHLIICVLLSVQGLSADLPQYSGPYKVGTIYIEVPATQPRNVTDTTLKNGDSAFRVGPPALVYFRSCHVRWKYQD